MAAGAAPARSLWRARWTDPLPRSLTHRPSPHSHLRPSFLPSSIFHPHPSPTLADSTTLNPVSTLPSSLPSLFPPPFQPLPTNTPPVAQPQHPISHLSLLVPLDPTAVSFVNALRVRTAVSPASCYKEQLKLTSSRRIVLCPRTWQPPVITPSILLLSTRTKQSF